MKISKTGLKLIKSFEGLYLKAYQDRVGVWTIGYGTTNHDKEITNTTIKSGLTITAATAESWLQKSLDIKYGPRVMKYDDKYHWTQNEYDALISFAYNIGHIDQLTNNGTRSRKAIETAWLLYDKAGGRHVKGLADRRKAELKLFKNKSQKSKTGNPYCSPDGTVTSTKNAIKLKLINCISEGEMVKAVQWELVRLGYYLGTPAIDGSCGDLTVTAIKEFQNKKKLTKDGACGNKTWNALINEPTQKQEEKEKEKPVINEKKIDYGKKMVASAKKVYPLSKNHRHGGGLSKKVISLKTLKKYKALSCNRMASITMQEAGLLPKNVIVSHTKKRAGKKTIKDAVKNYDKLINCKIYWVNKTYKNLPEKYKKPGCVYYQNSNACVNMGNGVIYSCNKSVGYKYTKKSDYYRKSGYPFTSRILVVVVPNS